MDSDEDFTTSINTFNTIIDSDDIVTSSSATGVQNDSEDDEFITPPNNFGTHWTDFYVQSKLKIPNYINIMPSVHISYLDKDINISSKKRKATLTDFFNKTSISPDKINELHTLLLQSLIYSNVPFRFVENPFFALFLKKLYSSYNLPSRYILTHRIMQAEYARVLLEMVDHLEESNNLTLSLDGWTDVSGNSIYAFLLHKFENINEVINIEDFSITRHTANNLLIAIETSLKNINLDFNKIIALVTDSPSVMIRLRKNISEKYKHIISIRCCLHVFNLIAKEILSYKPYKNLIKKNLILQTFCKTRWFSFSKVCLSVQNYEKGFKACLDYINNSNKCPIIPIKIKEIVTSQRHFLENEYIVDAIGKLESRNTTVGDVFAELYKVYKKLKMSENSDIDQEFIEHAKNIINIRAKEFDEPIYYLSFFLHPKFRKIAVSKKLSLDNMLIYALTFAQKWNFTREQANQISEQLNNYFNNEPPYNSVLTLEPRLYWKRLSYEVEALKTLALKIFAIHPHAAGVEQLFSSMGLTKTKSRNRLTTPTLKIISQIKSALAVEALKKVKNNQVLNNTDEDTNFVELEDYDTLFTSSSDTNDNIE
ncbi:1341_t:CDS:2 [Cetraspora pellucida]|uniref:1341_t:CDS:1 n=1 Tax=Cetraspora pellucida TaxID=1433469 RepID=A0ACA9KWM7_9GLOM|nr:1341_t:CDS:2 [Cetraspora pellucida]